MFRLLVVTLSFLCFSCTPVIATDSKYSRAEFEHWVDIDNDGLDSRQQALARSSLRPVVTKDGVIVWGLWVCPYTGTTVTVPSKVDVDHVLSLKNAWDRGASEWDAEKRKQFANDQRNLVVVQSSANRQKGAKGPDEWLPPNKNIQAEYTRWVHDICLEYGLVGCSIVLGGSDYND